MESTLFYVLIPECRAGVLKQSSSRFRSVVWRSLFPNCATGTLCRHSNMRLTGQITSATSPITQIDHLPR